MECKSSATVTPDMTAPMRKVAKAFASEGIEPSMQLVYNPGKGAGYSALPVGLGVSPLSLPEFVAR